jgi:hypothetical protein
MHNMPTHISEYIDRRDVAARDALLERFRSEMRHVPALALTLPQAARLFNLEPETCERLIATLAQEGHVYVRSDGRFVSTPT